MADYPYTVPEGYTEGMSGGSYDPDTGERKSWALPPAPRRIPPDMSGMNSINWNAVQENIKNQGVDAALKQARAAELFLAQRGYQNDITAASMEPDPIKRDALKSAASAKWIPIMFRDKPSGVGSLLGATTITPNQAARNAFEERRVKVLENKASQPPPPIFRSGPRGAVNAIDPKTLTSRVIIPGEEAKAVISELQKADTKVAREAYEEAAKSVLAAGPRKEAGFAGFGGNIDKIMALENAKIEAKKNLMTASGTRKPKTLSEQVATSGPAQSTSPAPVAPPILPLPKSKDELKTGQRYITARGEATWNGEKFVK